MGNDFQGDGHKPEEQKGISFATAFPNRIDDAGGCGKWLEEYFRSKWENCRDSGRYRKWGHESRAIWWGFGKGNWVGIRITNLKGVRTGRGKIDYMLVN